MELITLLFLTGQILLGGYFVVNGVGHLAKFKNMAHYVASKGVPFPKLSVLFWTLFILTTGFGIALGVYPQWSAGFLGIFLFPVTFIMHAFWKETDPQQRVIEQAQFMKNLALAGALLALTAMPEPWALTLF